MRTYFAIVCLALGVMLFVEGYHLKQKDRTLPATTRRGPMTGAHAMFAGAVCFTFGVAWMWVAVRHKK